MPTYLCVKAKNGAHVSQNTFVPPNGAYVEGKTLVLPSGMVSGKTVMVPEYKTESYSAKTTAEKPYLRVGSNYFPLSTELTSLTGLQVRIDDDVATETCTSTTSESSYTTVTETTRNVINTYRVKGSYTTSIEAIITTGTSYNTRESTYSTTYGTRTSTSETGYLTRTSTSETGYLTRTSTSETGYLTRSSTSQTGYLTRSSTSATVYNTRSSTYTNQTGYLTQKSTSQTGYATRSSKYFNGPYYTTIDNTGLIYDNIDVLHTYQKYVSHSVQWTHTEKWSNTYSFRIYHNDGSNGISQYTVRAWFGDCGENLFKSSGNAVTTVSPMQLGTVSGSGSEYYRKSDGVSLAECTATSIVFSTPYYGYDRISATINFRTNVATTGNWTGTTKESKTVGYLRLIDNAVYSTNTAGKPIDVKASKHSGTYTYSLSGYVYYTRYHRASTRTVATYYDSASRASTSATTYGTRSSTYSTTYGTATRASTSATVYNTRASTSATTYGTRASTYETTYGTCASTYETTYGTCSSTYETTYGTRSSTSETGYLTRSSTSETVYLTTTISSRTTSE